MSHSVSLFWRAWIGVAVFFLAPLAALAQGQPPPVGASSQIHAASGQLVATATLRELPDEVLINLTFADRTTLVGTHAIHIHEVGRCDVADFSTAGGIFNPFSKRHGLLDPDGPMAGDLPNLVIGPGGIGAYNLSAPLVKLTTGPAALLRQGGTSLVIYSGSDDDRTQPDGNAGTRLGCGVIVAGASAATSQPLVAGTPTGDAGRLNPVTAFVLAVVSVLVIGAAYLLRQQRKLRSPRG